MKHQALARVFAVVLAILCLLLLVTGVRGFGKADEELNERRAWEEKYAGRIQTYVELEAELAGSISYEEAQRELEKRLEQHEADASQHRTDTALHTAEKGGNQMGADLIWEAMPELQSAKGDLEEAKRQLAEKESVFAQGKLAVSAQVQNGVAACNAEKASLAGLAASLNGYLAENPPPVVPTEPQKPTAPEEPQMPTLPIDPNAFTWVEPQREAYVTAEEPVRPEDDSEEAQAAYDAAMSQYQSDLKDQEDAFEAAKEAYYAEKARFEENLSALQEKYAADMEAYQAKMDAYEARMETYPAEKAAYDEELRQYNADYAEYQQTYPAAAAAYQAWQMAYAGEVMRQAGPHIAAITSLGEDLAAAGESVAALAVGLGADAGSMAGAGTGGAAGGMPSGAQTPEQLAAALSGAVDGMIAGYGQISAGLGAMEAGLAEARNKVFEGELALKKAEAELQDQLANIWYNLGELEKEAEQLAEEKETLDQEAGVLSKKLLENEELKDLTNRRNSARQLLLNVAEVKSESAESGDLPGAAGSYLERYRAETQALDEGRRRVNVLAILGAAAGLLGIPGAFELTKKRVLLLAPVLLCLGFAAGADWLHVSLGLGQMYTALFTAIFAAIQFLIVLPKKKAAV